MEYVHIISCAFLRVRSAQNQHISPTPAARRPTIKIGRLARRLKTLNTDLSGGAFPQAVFGAV